jgi:hypothetical protein
VVVGELVADGADVVVGLAVVVAAGVVVTGVSVGATVVASTGGAGSSTGAGATTSCGGGGGGGGGGAGGAWPSTTPALALPVRGTQPSSPRRVPISHATRRLPAFQLAADMMA